MKRLILCVLFLAVLCGGCAADRATLDHRAVVMNGVADKLAAEGFPTAQAGLLDVAWIIENERRAAVNLSDSAHWRKETYPYPAKRPTTMPYTPEDDVPVGK